MGASPGNVELGQYSNIVASAVGTGASGLAAGAALAHTSITAILGTTGAAALGIGAAVAGLVAVLMKLFPGADPLQVPASQIEQIFEAAADNLHYLAQAKIISKAEALAGCESFIQAAVQYETQMGQKYNHPRPFGNAITNATAVIREQEAEIQALPDYPDPSGPINFTAAQQAYFTATADTRPGHWYAPSVAAAKQVTDTYLQSLKRTVPAILANAVTSVGNAVGDAVSALVGPDTGAKVQGAVAANPLLTILILIGLFLLLRKIL